LKISNLCNHNTSTLRTDRQTDGQTTCHSNTALCVASRGKNCSAGGDFFDSHCIQAIGTTYKRIGALNYAT